MLRCFSIYRTIFNKRIVYDSASSVEKYTLSSQISVAERRKGCQESFYIRSEVATAAIRERPFRSVWGSSEFVFLRTGAMTENVSGKDRVGTV